MRALAMAVARPLAPAGGPARLASEAPDAIAAEALSDIVNIVSGRRIFVV